MQVERVLSANHQVLDYAKFIMSTVNNPRWNQFVVRTEYQTQDPETHELTGSSASEKTYTGPLNLQIQFVFLDRDNTYKYMLVDTRFWRHIGGGLVDKPDSVDNILQCKALTGFMNAIEIKDAIDSVEINPESEYKFIKLQDFKTLHIPGGIFNMHFIPNAGGYAHYYVKPFASMTNSDKITISPSMLKIDLIRDRTHITITPLYDVD